MTANAQENAQIIYQAANEVLVCQENLFQASPPLKMEVQVEIAGKGSRFLARGNARRYQLVIRENQKIIDVNGWSAAFDSQGNMLTNPDQLIRQRSIESLFLEQRLQPGPSMVSMDTKAPESFKKMHFDSRCGWMLDGYFYGCNQQSVVELLKSATNLEIIPDQANQHLVLLQGITKFGYVEGWFDPNKRCLLVGYRITKGPEDLFDLSKLNDIPVPSDVLATVGWRAEIRDIETVEINGFHVAASGTAMLTLTDVAGEINTFIYSIKRSKIQIDPDPVALARIENFIPEGIEVRYKQRPGIKYTFVNSELRPVVDVEAIKQTDVLLEKYRTDGKNDHDSIESDSGSEPNAYCGLYCLYARARLAGLDVRFEELLRPEFVGSADGTSIGELIQAANSLGLQTTIYSDLAPQYLKEANTPLILYVRQTSKSVEPDHYILLLEIRGDRAIVFDPPTEMRGPRIRSVAIPVLAAQWNRAAIASAPLSMTMSMENKIMSRAGLIALLVGAALLLLMTANRFSRYWGNWRVKYLARTPTQVVTIVLSSLVLATAFGVMASDGIRLDEAGREAAQLLYQRRYPNILMVEQLPSLIHSGSVIFVDARLKQGPTSIPHSLHIPYNTPPILRIEELAGLDKSVRIVTYCEPFGCPVSARLATVLEDDGFTNVQVLEGDWRPFANLTSE